MKVNWIERVARTAEVLMVLSVVLCITIMAQFMIGEAYLFLWNPPYRVSAPVAVDGNNVTPLDVEGAGKVFLVDGRFVLTIQEMQPGQLGQTRLTVMEPNNHVFYQGPRDKQPLTFMDWSSGDEERSRQGWYSTMAPYLPGLQEVTAEFSRMLIVPVQGPDHRLAGTWRYDVRRRVFRGQDVTGGSMGTIGSNGFFMEAKSAQSFDLCMDLLSGQRPNRTNPLLLFVGTQTLYRIDLDARQVETLVQSDSPIRLHRCHWGSISQDALYRPSLAAFTKTGETTILLENPNEVIRCSIPSKHANHPTPPMVVATQDKVFMQVMETAGLPDTQDESLLDQWRRQSRDRQTQHTIRLIEVSRSGTLREISSFSWIRPPRRIDEWYTRYTHVWRVVNVVSSPMLHQCLSGISDAQRRAMPTYLSETLGSMGHIRYNKAPYQIATCSIVMALLALLHAWPRRTTWGRLAFWVVMVLAFNLAGLLTYLALNHTPVIGCSACGRRRGLLRPDCPACHGPLPVPQARPTDLVFPAA